MITKKSSSGYRGLLEGVHFKALAHGAKTLLCEFHLEKGAVIPMHRHPNEQTGYMVSGRMDFTIGAERFLAEAGDSWSIPPDQEHGVTVLEDSVVLEVFSPVREDYLQ
ncbi:MAG: cupin domain-containing protein [Planctomycetota bacterium]